MEKEFIKKTMSTLVKMSSQFNAAIVLYNNEATVQLNFTQNFDINHFFNVIDSLESRDLSIYSQPRADYALQVTSECVFGTQGGFRLNKPKIAVLLTRAGFPFALKGFSLRKAAESLKDKSVRLLIVDIEPHACKAGLFRITEHRDDYIMVEGYSSLPQYVDILIKRICSAIGQYYLKTFSSLSKGCKVNYCDTII